MASTFGWGGVGMKTEKEDMALQASGDGEVSSSSAARIPVANVDVRQDHTNEQAKQADGAPAWARGVVAQDSAKKSNAQSGYSKANDAKGKALPSKPPLGKTASKENLSRKDNASVASERALNQKLVEIERREYALREKEKHIKDLEKQLQDGGLDIKPKNWPKCRPILYHDIRAEVPSSNQPCCKAGYACWMLSVSAYLYNFFAVTIMFFMGTGSLACWFFAALATVLGIFFSWWAWYSGLYKALQSQGGVWPYGKYFIHKAIFVGWSIWVFIAPPIGTAQCFVAGFFVMIDQFGLQNSKGTVGGIICIINIVLWGLTAALATYTLIWTFTIWKRGGGLEAVEQQRQQASSVFNNAAVNNTAQKLFGGAPPS